MPKRGARRPPSWLRKLKDHAYLVTVFLRSCAAGLMVVQTQYVYTTVARSYTDDLDSLTNSTGNLCGSSPANASSEQSKLEAEISTEAARWTMYATLASGVPSIFTILLLGSRSDQVGRRFIFLLNLTSAVIHSAILCAVIHFGLPLFYLVIGDAIEGVTGGGLSMMIASFSHSSDQHNADPHSDAVKGFEGGSEVAAKPYTRTQYTSSSNYARTHENNPENSDSGSKASDNEQRRSHGDDDKSGQKNQAADELLHDKNRSVRLLAIECFSVMAFGCLQMTNGYFIQFSGYFYPALAATSVLLLNIVFTFFFVVDSEKQARSERTRRSVLEPLKIVFTAVRQPQKLWAFLLCNVALTVLVFGDGGLLRTITIYQMSPPYCWTSLELGWFSSEMYFVTILAVPFLVVLKRFNFSDPTMAGIGVLIDALGTAVYAVAGNNGWIFYLAAVLTTPGMLAYSLTRTITSRLAGPEAHGSMFAFTALMEQIMFLVGAVTGSGVYQSTVDKFHSAVFIYYAAIYFISSLVYFLEAYIHRGHLRQRDKLPDFSVNS